MESGQNILPKRDAGFAFRALRNRDYRLLFFPQTLSLCGFWMQHTAQAWLVYRLSDSPGWLGAITFCTLFPIFVFSLWAGVLGDKYSRRWILWVVNLGAMMQALVLAGLTLGGVVTIEWIACLALLQGILSAFEIPARQAIVLDIVSRDTLPSAIALNSSSFNIARLVGPLLAGFMIGFWGEGICFLINALTYPAALVALLLLKTNPSTQVEESGSHWDSLLVGLAYVRKSSDLKSLLLLMGGMSLFGIWFMTFMPVFARDVYQGGPDVLGQMIGAVAFGALLGAFLLGHRDHIFGLGKWITGGALGLSAGIVVFPNLDSYIPALVVLFLMGLAMVIHNVGITTMIQTLAPDRMRSRIASVSTFAFLGVGPIGALAAGLVAEKIGAPAMMTGAGVGCLMVAVFLGGAVKSIQAKGPDQLETCNTISAVGGPEVPDPKKARTRQM